ncbi:MAG: hypothetical protein ACTSR8_13535 [Promethearchaeota archaeon]
MSKTKKQARDRSTTISETDIKFVKSIQFAGWIFIIILAGFIGTWLTFDYLPDFLQKEFDLDVQFLNIIDLNLDATTYSFIIMMGTLGPLCFALSSKLNKNLDKKREIFLDWIIAILLFNVFALASIAAYQW